jgi:hypothetical protein
MAQVIGFITIIFFFMLLTNIAAPKSKEKDYPESNLIL